jgi:hypothetical protein
VLTVSQSINYVICSCDSLVSEISEHRWAYSCPNESANAARDPLPN